MADPTPSACPCTLVKPRLRRRVGYSRTHGFDFSDYAESEAGQTISTVTVTVDPADLTLGVPVASGSEVQVAISGGRVGITYELTFRVTWSGGAVVTPQALVETCA